MNYARKAISAITSLAVLTAMILFLAFPARYAGSVKDGISLWAFSVLPATLPFLFLTAIFTNLNVYKKISRILSPIAGKLFGVSGEGGCAALLSAISGYPVGARTVYDLVHAGRIRKEEQLRVSCLCTTSGPAFLVGAVGCGMLKSPIMGWILFISHLAGIYLVCFLLRLKAKPQKMPMPIQMPAHIDLADIIMNAVLSVLCVGAAIAIFYAFGQMIADMGAFVSLPPTAEALVRGLLEMTTGCALFAQNPSPLTLAMSCFLVTFGGICVLVQQIAFLSRAGIKVLPFVCIKFLQGIASALICFALSFIIF